MKIKELTLTKIIARAANLPEKVLDSWVSNLKTINKTIARSMHYSDPQSRKIFETTFPIPMMQLALQQILKQLEALFNDLCTQPEVGDEDELCNQSLAGPNRTQFEALAQAYMHIAHNYGKLHEIIPETIAEDDGVSLQCEQLYQDMPVEFIASFGRAGISKFDRPEDTERKNITDLRRKILGLHQLIIDKKIQETGKIIALIQILGAQWICNITNYRTNNTNAVLNNLEHFELLLAYSNPLKNHQDLPYTVETIPFINAKAYNQDKLCTIAEMAEAVLVSSATQLTPDTLKRLKFSKKLLEFYESWIQIEEKVRGHVPSGSIASKLQRHLALALTLKQGFFALANTCENGLIGLISEYSESEEPPTTPQNP